MKRHLSVGEGYARKPLNFKPFTLSLCSEENASLNKKIGWLDRPISWAKVTGLSSLVAFFCFCLSVGGVSAQDSDRQLPSSIQPITAGMRLPEEFWTTEFQFYDHEKVYTQTLEQYKGKPIILGFWSIYCGACKFSFPFLGEMAAQYPDDIIVLPVNSQMRETTDAIERSYKRMPESDKYKLPAPSIIFDEYLKYLFPHRPIPHYIWIQADGKIGGITRRSFLTESNILNLIQ